MKLPIVVIIPTYNASETIIQLIRQIIKLASNIRIVVVDDNSPDGTSKIIGKQFMNQERVIVVNRSKKDGRGSAVIYGFLHGLQYKDTEYFVEMDSDLVHNPIFILDMVKKCKEYDIVVASRYIKSSKIIGWKLKRRVFSWFANTILNISLGIPITDYTNGFRCYKREVIEKTDFTKIQSKGFIVLSEIAYTMYKSGFTFGEIPFVFKSFDNTKSNMSFKEIKEAIMTISRIKLLKNSQ